MYNTPRLKGYDYRKAGIYFTTINCFLMECRLGDIICGRMLNSTIGDIACQEWQLLPERFSCLHLIEFQLMPNHIHALLEITPCEDGTVNQFSLSDIIGSYKSIVYNKALVQFKAVHAGKTNMPRFGKLWSRSFHDSIVRDWQSFKSITRYIRNNPKKWNRL